MLVNFQVRLWVNFYASQAQIDVEAWPRLTLAHCSYTVVLMGLEMYICCAVETMATYLYICAHLTKDFLHNTFH